MIGQIGPYGYVVTPEMLTPAPGATIPASMIPTAAGTQQTITNWLLLAGLGVLVLWNLSARR